MTALGNWAKPGNKRTDRLLVGGGGGCLNGLEKNKKTTVTSIYSSCYITKPSMRDMIKL